jgi:putative addiction module component (TIGR02574 family)
MSPTVERILQEALELPEDARVDLAAALLDSVDREPPDADVEGAWRQEALRRLQEIRSGAVKPIPWDEARSMIFGPSDVPKDR